MIDPQFKNEPADAAHAGDSELEAQLEAVEIQTEEVAKRQRRITSQIAIAHPRESVWKVLTDYESLPEFIPSLEKSQRLEHPEGEKVRLEQVGKQKLLKMNFSARVVLDLEEAHPERIDFEMVEGDFKAFSGYWFLEPKEKTTQLVYSIFVWPPRTMPVSLIERRLSKDLSLNLVAIRQRVDQLFG
ncbi:cyclase/dehydrase [Halothece sp. PCC 7418]|uniref:SRPBCC family protein n=1 Tax=Halothece sp. (strain PCC 7418) TaxID=65093 RepID=UPI0002A07B3E|nr:SRPBCC family protein [Halothece sp. PCC 7418]AFZ42984.1 cyclase/dehydrase [Halothece sp. PCC 7418]